MSGSAQEPGRHYPNGKRVAPLYESASNVEVSWRNTAAWTMVQEHAVTQEYKANEWALKRLQHGANGLLFYLTPDHYLPRILKDIQLELIDLHLVVEGSGPEVMESLLHYAHDEVIPAGKLRGTINIDPIEIMARTGKWDESKMYELGELSRLCPKGMNFLCVNANIWAAAGASVPVQLGLATAHMSYYLEHFGSVAADRFWLNMSTGAHFFLELSKFRAARLLWARLLEVMNLPATALTLYGESSATEQTLYDPHTNLLRNTSGASAAILGGVDEFQMKPYNATAVEADPEAERLALNQQLIMSYESFMDKVDDPGAGSYFIENLTQELCAEAWELYMKIEDQGGIQATLASGYIQDLLEAEVKKQQPDQVLGVNQFPLDGEQPLAKPAAVMSRAEHQKKYAGRDCEPVQQIRWSQNLEVERTKATSHE